MKKLLLYLAILIAGFASCKKDQQQPGPASDPSKGSISGTISPAGAVTSITATSQAQPGLAYTVSPDPATGIFKIDNIVPGAYTVIFTNALNFVPIPAIMVVTVTANQNTNLGNFSLQPVGTTSGSITGTVSPSGAVTGITATNQAQSSLVYTAVPDAATGAFKMDNVVAGGYNIVFTYASTFTVPQYVYAIVAPGQNKDVGNISFQGGGVITGTISPAGSVTNIFASNTQTNSLYAASIDAVTGVFKTTPVPAGNYSLTFYTAQGFKSPGSATVTVTTGQTINAGTFVMLPNVLSGIPFTGPVLQTYAAPNLTLYSSRSNSQTGADTTFKVIMDNITGPGTYTCQGTSTSNITYTIYSSGGPFATGKQWSSSNTGGSGTVVVTSVDPVKKEIKGTFTATLVSTIAGASNVVINNGSFYFGY